MSANNTIYDDEFYSAQQDRSSIAAAAISEILSPIIQPRSVLDVGCGVGGWLAAFQKSGAIDIVGIDGGYVNLENLRIDPECFYAKDVSQPFDLGRQFDIVMSIEVAEHLPASSATQFIENLTRHGDVVLFSAATPFQGGVSHVNERWQSYWAEIFAVFGFEPIDAIRPQIWCRTDIMYWYKQGLILYVKSEKAKQLRQKLQVAEIDMPIDIIHPDRYLQAADPHQISFKRSLLGLAYAISRYVGGKF